MSYKIYNHTIQTNKKVKEVYQPLENLSMQIRIANLTLLCTKKRDHREALWYRIHELRKEIVDDVLLGSVTGRMPVKQLKHKAKLIKNIQED